jgi:hypothetical protein
MGNNIIPNLAVLAIALSLDTNIYYKTLHVFQKLIAL